MSATQWLVYCPAHRHYLVRASSGGTTWNDDQDQARRYTKRAAQLAVQQATWLDHNPMVWPLAESTAEVER